MSRLIASFIHNNNAIDDLPNLSVELINKLIDEYSKELEADYPYVLSQYRAYLWILHRSIDSEQLTFSDIAAIHWCMYKYIDNDAGMLREDFKKIRDYECPNPNIMSFYIKKLNSLLSIIDDVKNTSEEELNGYLWYVHNVFQCIQPFKFGNGRVGRFLFNSLRMKCGISISEWNVDKYFYFNAIKKFEKTFEERYSPAIGSDGLGESELRVQRG